MSLSPLLVPLPEKPGRGFIRAITLAVLLLGAFGGGALILLGADALTRFQAGRCPRDTFLVPSTNALGITLAPLVLLSFALAAVLVFWIVSLMPSLSQRWDSAAIVTNDPPLRSVRKFILWFSAFWLVVSAITLPVAVFNQSCLAPSGVYEQNMPWGNLKRRAWSQVVAVETSCRKGRGGWGDSYILRFADGSHVDLEGGTTGDWTRVFPQLRMALHGGKFFFNDYQVGLGCSLPEVELLRTRP